MSSYIPILVRADDMAAVTQVITERAMQRGDNGLPESVDVARRASQATPRSPSNARAADPGGAPNQPIELSPEAVWDEADLARLAAGSTITTQRWTKAMDVCAQSPMQYLPTREVARRAGLGLHEWRDAPRKLSKHLAAHYPNVPRHEDGWAFWPLHHADRAEHPGEQCWVMSDETAKRWKRVRDGQA